MFTWERALNVLRVIVAVIEIFALPFGACVAWKAYEVYRSQAAISVINHLDETYEKLTKMEMDNSCLNSFYLDLKNDLASKEEADLYLAMLAGCNPKRHHSRNSGVGPPLPTWEQFQNWIVRFGAVPISTVKPNGGSAMAPYMLTRSCTWSPELTNE